MSASVLSLSLGALRQGYAAGDFGPADVVEEIYRRIGKRGNDAVWIDLASREESLASVREMENRKKGGRPLPLYGIPFAIKDNIDWEGRPTTAGCPAYSYLPGESATAVRKLIEAGAIPIGKTNLDQFATGLVGVRSPYGAPRCVFDAEYISGGSSSGSAVAVAAGLVSFSLGTDTAGSGRVPAAFNHIVGLKPTRGRVSAAGVVPACRSLDCVSIFALSAAEACEILIHLEGADSRDPWSRNAPDRRPLPFGETFRYGTPRASQLEFFGDDAAALLYRAALERLDACGGQRIEIDYAPFRETAALLYEGPWVAERLAAIGAFYRNHSEKMDPTVRQIIGGAEKYSAVDTFAALYRLQELQQRIDPVWKEIDLLVLPTAPTHYTVAEIEANPIQLNANLGTYTNFVNLLDLCGVALPAGFRSFEAPRGGLPFGITFLATAFRDEALLALASRFSSP